MPLLRLAPYSILTRDGQIRLIGGNASIVWKRRERVENKFHFSAAPSDTSPQARARQRVGDSWAPPVGTKACRWLNHHWRKAKSYFRTGCPTIPMHSSPVSSRRCGGRLAALNTLPHATQRCLTSRSFFTISREPALAFIVPPCRESGVLQSHDP